MREVLRAVHTENKPNKVRTHHQQYVKDIASGPNIDGGSAFPAMISGRMNSTASQPHANSLGLRSCHSATKMEINALVTASRCVPLSGT